MDWFANNWPMLLVALGVFVVLSGIMRRLARLAFLGVALGVLGLIVWPVVSGSL